MYNDLERILITKEQINARVKELAAELDRDYAGKKPIVVCILKGSALFFADLVREMTIPLEFDFLAISSYGNKTKSSGEVKMVKDLDNLIENRHVLIIEDIVDSGYTLSYLKKLLASRSPASVKVCTLLDKKSRREVPLVPDYCCFDIEDYFVVGYGLDYAQKYRNLPEIGVLKPEVYSK